MSIDSDANPDQVRESVAHFTRDVINPALAASGGADAFTRCWSLAADFGLLGVNIGKEYGGSGLTLAAAVAAMESLGENCSDNGFAFAVNVSVFTHAATLSTAAGKQQKRKYLAPLCRGERICAYALTEENAGSDAYALETRADLVDKGYVLSGRKLYISLGPIADFALVFASTDSERGRWGLTAFIVDLDTKGVTKTPTAKAGLETVPMGTIEFDHCFLPANQVLGTVGGGAAVFEDSQNWERSFVLASHVGAMKRQLENTLDFAKSRKQFGKSISRFQSVSNRIADMALRLETSRLMLERLVQLKTKGRPIRLESAMAKLHISECFHNNCLDAVRIYAAKGYTGDAKAVVDLNDSLAGLLIGGTNDIQRGIISRLMGA